MTESHPQQEGHTSFPDSGAKINTNTLELSDLPPELIILIASMLPTQSAGCLSLCNRAMSQILGPNTWRFLKVNPGMRASFLYDLSKDLPQYFVCYRCVQLHASSAVQWPRTIPKTLTRCLREERSLEYCSQSGIFLRFPHIQLVMNRHYLGPSHGFPLEALRSIEVIESDLYKNIVSLSVDAQIVSNELLLRSQQWVLLPHNRRDELVTQHFFRRLCEHIWDVKAGDYLPTLIKSRLDLLEEQGRCCTSTEQCLKCQMDFVMDVVDLGERGIAGCLTRWINLGAGLDPADPKWRSHLYKLSRREVTPNEPHPLGSIRSSFENQSTIPFKEFTARNTYNLLSRRERKLFTSREDGFTWKWVSRNPNRWCLEQSRPWNGTLNVISQLLLSEYYL
jgi:hypothetical protein